MGRRVVDRNVQRLLIHLEEVSGRRGTRFASARLDKPWPRTFAHDLMRYGVVFTGHDCISSNAEDQWCHACSLEWASRHNNARTYSGYALCGKTWATHSWVVYEGLLVECTTIGRDVYVGMPTSLSFEDGELMVSAA
jgi:hypothetical protein